MKKELLSYEKPVARVTEVKFETNILDYTLSATLDGDMGDGGEIGEEIPHGKSYNSDTF